MPILGKCPDCTGVKHDVILVAGRCAFHNRNPVVKKSSESVTKAAASVRKIATTVKKKGKKARKRIKPATDKTKRERAELALLVAVLLQERPVCEIRWEGCTVKATEVHHEAGRGRWMLVPELMRPGCHNCHELVGKYSARAIEEGMSLPRHNKLSFYEEIIQARRNAKK